MNLVGLDQKFVALARSDESVKRPLSEQEIVEKISSIDAIQIELIGCKIISDMLNTIGPMGKERMLNQIMKKNKTLQNEFMDTMVIQSMVLSKRCVKEGNMEFISEEDSTNFSKVALWPIKEVITHAFSVPNEFFESGLYFKLSDYEPMGILKETAAQLGIKMTLVDVPSRYYVFLKLDKKLTKEKSDLVFILTAESEGVEFSKKTFTLSELKADFYSIS